MVSAGNHGVYYSELKAYKKAPATKEMFDEYAHSGLARIQSDITIYKNLTSFQRFVRSGFLGLDVILVTPDTLPKLYEYVDGICKKADIATPTIFVTRHDGFFNAFAQKLFASTGGIIIGQKLMHEVSDEALEAIVAHEIGHIKHNHVNKILGLMAMSYLLYRLLCKALDLESVRVYSSETEAEKFLKLGGLIAKKVAVLQGCLLLPPLVINKQFEKEADAFACDNGKSEGIVEFFEFILGKEQLREEEFVAIHNLLQQNKVDLTFSDYYFDLMPRYYLEKFGHNIDKARRYIYHNTFLGAHPSPEARIAAAQKYLQQEA